MRVACVLDSGFEDSEFKKPVEGLRQAGHEVVVIGLKPDQELKGKRGDVTTRSDQSFDDVRPEDYDALLIPGGYSPDHLRADRRAVEFTQAAVARAHLDALTAGLRRPAEAPYTAAIP